MPAYRSFSSSNASVITVKNIVGVVGQRARWRRSASGFGASRIVRCTVSARRRCRKTEQHMLRIKLPPETVVPVHFLPATNSARPIFHVFCRIAVWVLSISHVTDGGDRVT